MQDYQYKLKPYQHQKTGCELSCDQSAFALTMEMGTGKSKVIVDTSAYLFQEKKIQGVVIIAPKGIHSKWIATDYPLSMSEETPWTGAVWRSGDLKSERACDKLCDVVFGLRVLAVNVDVFSNPKSKGMAVVKKFMTKYRCMMVIDESTRIKTPDSARTKNIMRIGDMAAYKRILSGLPVTNSPFDIYAQYTFLDKNIFGQSFFAFKHTFAEILPATDQLVRQIMAKSGSRFAPCLVAKDDQGRPKYKNLDKLKELIAHLTYRVTKKECLDLPDKIYQTVEYDLEPAQQKLYTEMKTKARAQLLDGNVTVQHKMLLLMRLQQILSGYLPLDDGGEQQLFSMPEDNPRMKALLDVLEDIDSSVVIWCRFQREVEQIERLLAGRCVTYYGLTKNREESELLFCTGQVQYLVGTPATGGIGLNFTHSDTVIYYSNDFDLEHRLQSEDRNHRIGQKNKVVYIEIHGRNTIDQYITKKLRNKEIIAHEITDLAKEL